MKNKKRMASLLAVMIVLALAACGRVSEEADAMEVMVPEASASELLADSLEYLLNENEEQLEETEKEEEAEPKVDVIIYYGNGASDELNTEVSAMERITAENLIEALNKHNIVSIDTKVNSFEEQEIDGVKTLHLDLSGAFREYLKTMTQKGENIIMASVSSTFLEAYDAEEIVITVEGTVLETEHAAYTEPLRFYTPEQLMDSGKTDKF